MITSLVIGLFSVYNFLTSEKTKHILKDKDTLSLKVKNPYVQLKVENWKVQKAIFDCSDVPYSNKKFSTLLFAHCLLVMSKDGRDLSNEKLCGIDK